MIPAPAPTPPTSPTWEIVTRPGYFGARRDSIEASWDSTYGPDNWTLGWVVGEIVVSRVGMNMLYEDAYFAYLEANPDIVDTLTSQAYEVYDDAVTNVASGLDYTAQETDRTHVQDIAIRRALVRLGRAFHGDTLIRIRHDQGNHPLSMILSPGCVPFHRPI
jgi:hypothetical protein